jgi:hypothetical protein
MAALIGGLSVEIKENVTLLQIHTCAPPISGCLDEYGDGD